MKDDFKRFMTVNTQDTKGLDFSVEVTKTAKKDTHGAPDPQIDSETSNEEEVEWCDARVKELEEMESRLQDMSRRICLLQHENSELHLKPDEVSFLVNELSDVEALSAGGMSWLCDALRMLYAS